MKKRFVFLVAFVWSGAVCASVADPDHRGMQKPTPHLVFAQQDQGGQSDDFVFDARAFGASASGVVLPKVGANGVGFDEQRHNRAIAEWSLQQVNGSMPQIHDPWVVDTVYRLSAQMNALARAQSLLAVPVLSDRSVNAFAVPGGLIAINAGVFSAADSLDESASVIAHEIAHLSLRHYERTSDNRGKLLALQLGGFLAAIAAASTGSEAAAAMMIGSQTLSAEQAAAHSRDHEREADRVGMQILAQAGYDPYAMPAFFEKLSRYYALNVGQDAFVPSFVRSHPFSGERQSEAFLRAAAIGRPSVFSRRETERLFDLLVWRVRLFSQDASEENLRQAATTSAGAALAYAAYLADKNRFAEARAALAKVKGDDPLFCVSQAYIAYRARDFDEAAQILRPCQTAYPERRDLAIYLADSVLQQGDAAAAEGLLEPLIEKNDRDLVALRLLEKVYIRRAIDGDKNRYTAKALWARGQAQLWSGRYAQALQSFGQAADLVDGRSTLGRTIAKASERARFYRDFRPK